ncbi:hypothetical protein PROVALCAL_02206 [Providencia alcalifaciens DSM 30120]|uniref:Uncharacterized protein n=1 Tax=Providencia alcalifaciens DSM 30120 TaxID=520999 RepID=B6XFS2_9GAMM|nr:hypothetical protein PROVALCAL_02206 [Providencia alcalifaciens DSM 30120]
MLKNCDFYHMFYVGINKFTGLFLLIYFSVIKKDYNNRLLSS